MRIVATPVRAGELRPGDLFSTMNQRGWDHRRDTLWGEGGFVGEKVYIRTSAPCPHEEKDAPIYRLEVVDG